MDHDSVRSLLLVAACLAPAPAAWAQARQPGEAVAAWSRALGADVPTVLVPAPDIERYLAEDDARGHVPLRYGALIPVRIDLVAEGRWETSERGDLVCRLRLSSPGAHSLGLELATFRVPVGGRLFVYDDQLENVFGAYDHNNHVPDGEFTLEPFPGDTLVLEYQQSPSVTDPPQLVVDHVIHDYRDIDRVLALGGGCTTVDVNCPEGDPFANQKRATVRTLSGGSTCSGVLLNNTAFDGTQYLYTANHCGQTNNTVFRFNQEKDGCDTGAIPPGQNVSGATVLVTDCPTDARLMRIEAPIPSEFCPYFAGWTRKLSNIQVGVSLHHPGGGPKKISIDSDGGGKGVANLGFPCSVDVWVLDHDVGSTMPGSSGGPLFGKGKRVRGHVSGVLNGACSTSLYARFFDFYANANLSPFLDPLGTGANGIFGFDPGPLTIDAIAPVSVAAIAVDGPATATLEGCGFLDATSVTVAGVAAAFAAVDDSTLTLEVPLTGQLGLLDVVVTDPLGSATVKLRILPNAPPVVDVDDSDPALISAATGAQAQVGARPGDLYFLGVSPDAQPSVLPGLVSIDIGNNFATLLLLDSGAIPGQGYVDRNFPFPPVTGTVFWQAAVFAAAQPGFPLVATNVQQTNLVP